MYLSFYPRLAQFTDCEPKVVRSYLQQTFYDLSMFFMKAHPVRVRGLCSGHTGANELSIKAVEGMDF